MATKNEPGAFDCYARAAPNEPMFVLLARDASAPARVRDWAHAREDEIMKGLRPSADMEQVREARQVAADMMRWRLEHE